MVNDIEAFVQNFLLLFIQSVKVAFDCLTNYFIDLKNKLIRLYSDVFFPVFDPKKRLSHHRLEWNLIRAYFEPLHYLIKNRVSAKNVSM